MKFLVDECINLTTYRLLRDAGIDVEHVLDHLEVGASDSLIVAKALELDRSILTADSDFSRIIVHSQRSKPSVVFFSQGVDFSPELQVEAILSNSGRFESALESGAIVRIQSPTSIRLRHLPI